jgi:hypothetical protein
VTQTVDAATTGGLNIGSGKSGGSRSDWYAGRIDEVRTYQRVLSNNEIAALYADSAHAVAPEVTHVPSVTTGLTGALQGAQQGQTASAAVAFQGTGNAYNPTQYTNPTTFTLECWYKVAAGATTGGPLIGFATGQTGWATGYDRLLYLTAAQRIAFGVNPGTPTVITSPAAVSTGAWHHVVASLGAGGMRLYVDGVLVASNGTTTAQNLTGYWRWGGFPIGGWASDPGPNLVGLMDEVAVYPTQLSDQDVAWHYHANH